MENTLLFRYPNSTSSNTPDCYSIVTIVRHYKSSRKFSHHNTKYLITQWKSVCCMRSIVQMGADFQIVIRPRLSRQEKKTLMSDVRQNYVTDGKATSVPKFHVSILHKPRSTFILK